MEQEKHKKLLHFLIVKTLSAPFVEVIELAGSQWHFKNHVYTIGSPLYDWNLMQRLLNLPPQLVNNVCVVSPFMNVYKIHPFSMVTCEQPKFCVQVPFLQCFVADIFRCLVPLGRKANIRKDNIGYNNINNKNILLVSKDNVLKIKQFFKYF